MMDEGFFPYPYEWWHFDFKDWRDYPILNIPFEAIGSPGTATAARTARAVDLTKARIVDLTHSFDEKTLYWPNSPSAFELKTQTNPKTPAGFFYSSNAFCTPEHGGTHLDAPIHFSEGAASVDQIPVNRLIGNGVVIDIREACAKNPDYRLTVEDVARWEKVNGKIPKDAIVLLLTGWGRRWPDRKSYFGDDTPGDIASYGKEAAELLINGRGVSAIGVDTPSIDYGPSADFLVHQVAGAAGVPGLENIANLEEVPATGASIVALPMKIARGSGGPLRIVAILGDPPALKP
jgi:kynurenine formamidase